LKSPIVAEVLGGLCAALSYLPNGVVNAVVSAVTGQPEDAVEATRLLVTSPGLVKQAIRMAGEEMSLIAEDKWDDEVWHGSGRRMVFVFASQDQWVAENTMQKIKDSRGGDGHGKVRCILDNTGIPHGFCTTRDHSERTALVTAEAVLNMLKTPDAI
jgi:hypothetical protein